MSSARKIFEKQGLHAVALAGLLMLTAAAAGREGVTEGSLWGITTPVWLWAAVAVAIVHQLWVWLCWRLELHKQWLSRHFGDAGFRIYAGGFAVLGPSRVLVIIALAAANQGTLDVNRGAASVLATLMLIPALYLGYSVKRYFGFRRALGADHFDPSYRNLPLVREGIFRFTRNGMYTFGFFVVWLPGLYAASQAALLAAAFNHAYIWVHYFATELPDMRRIHGPDRIDQA